jgi:hypothetical protein
MRANFLSKSIVFLGLLLLTWSVSDGQHVTTNKNKHVRSRMERGPFKAECYQKIMDKHTEFVTNNHNDNANNVTGLSATDYIVIDRSGIDAILKNKEKSILSVMGWDGHKLTVDVLPIDSAATPVLPNGSPLKMKQDALKMKIGTKRPLGLDAFPLLIKMERNGFERIEDATSCRSFLFFPCIQKEWENDPHADENHKRHFTLGVLGSEPDRDVVNHLHIGKNVKQGEKRKLVALSSLYGEETWPEANFSWYTQ